MTLKIFLLVIFFTAFAIPQTFAATDFGYFEAPLPNIGTDSIDEFISTESPTLEYVAIIINFITVSIVVIGVIFIVIGGFIYMTAGGDSGKITKAKTFIGSSLLGIALALGAYLILTSVSTQFTSDLKDPKDLLQGI